MGQQLDDGETWNWEFNRRLEKAAEQEPRRPFRRRDERIVRDLQKLRSAMVGFRPTGGGS
ncbi:MAG: hypothetical protein AB7O24_04380 [Kofleriaceae bacterium]